MLAIAGGWIIQGAQAFAKNSATISTKSFNSADSSSKKFMSPSQIAFPIELHFDGFIHRRQVATLPDFAHEHF